MTVACLLFSSASSAVHPDAPITAEPAAASYRTTLPAAARRGLHCFRTLAALSKQVPEDGSYERVRPTDCRVVGLVGAGGIEPPTSTSQKWRPTSGLRPVGLNTRLHAGADDRARNKGDLLQDKGHLEPITGRF